MPGTTKHEYNEPSPYAVKMLNNIDNKNLRCARLPNVDNAAKQARYRERILGPAHCPYSAHEDRRSG
jgi:hypothetical protein